MVSVKDLIFKERLVDYLDEMILNYEGPVRSSGNVAQLSFGEETAKEVSLDAAARTW